MNLTGSLKTKVVIIGGGPAGLTAAIYAARALLEPIVIEGYFAGGQLTITTDVENYPGFAEPVSGPKLVGDMREQALRYGARFITQDVDSIDFSSRPFLLKTESSAIEAQSVIIATGAKAKMLGLDSEKRLIGRGVSTCATCDGFFYKNKKVIVVGGGDAALEEASFLTRFADQVTIVHRRDSFRASKIMVSRAQSNAKIKFAMNTVVEEILDRGQGVVSGIKLKNVKTGVQEELDCDGVFIAIGHEPNSKLFDGKLDLDPRGYIMTSVMDAKTSTAVEGVFACGDVQDPVYRQAVTAAASGCMAALDAQHYLEYGLASGSSKGGSAHESNSLLSSILGWLGEWRSPL
jgi:thioredoxin reductase (NADPH)